MKRKIITIDERKCNGCGLCVPACHEGALAIVDGKARLVKDSYCDGLGDCLGECPQGAITIEERDVDAYDEAAVQKHLAEQAKAPAKPAPPAGGCPGLRAFSLATAKPAGGGCPGHRAVSLDAPKAASAAAPAASALSQWPIQLHLVSPNAPYWQDADLLVAADCVLAAYPRLHQDLLPGRKLIIACPKLDDTDNYVAKLAAILGGNSIRSLTVARMEVPCCAGICLIAEQALARAGRDIPFHTVTIGIQGDILDRN